MVFEDVEQQMLNYQFTLISPDLRPINLPMSGNEKTFDGMINLSSANISLPGSDAFSTFNQYHLNGQYAHMNNDSLGIFTTYQDDQECCSDSDHGYANDCEAKTMVSAHPMNQMVLGPANTNVEPLPASRKRKASPGDDYTPSQPQKKAALTSVEVHETEGGYYEVSQQSPYSPYVVVTTNQINTGSPRLGHHYSTSTASQVSLAAPSPHTPAWSPSFTTVKTEQSPCAPLTPIPRPASTSTPYSAVVPKLVRTSTIPQQPSPVAVMNVSAHTHAFNPYAMYSPHKASLQLNGDLDAIALEWSDEELEARRKLIVFTRTQNGSVIDTDFKAVSQDEWQRSDITVNCIWWKEKKEAFVTSVDTIALLEQLVAVRFTVEEKNRIRRNLEGFRPLTVSKAKADSEDFFKVIMGFPNPKPRNIEKDVKVFPWRILGHALKKIISKYSASYSSTASTLVAPAASIFPGTERAVEYRIAQSPRREHLQHSMTSNAMPMVANFEAQMQQGRMNVPVAPTFPDLSLQVSHVPAQYDLLNSYNYEIAPAVSYPMETSQHVMTAPAHMPNNGWDFVPYTNVENVMPMQVASAPPSAFPHGHPEPTHFTGLPAYQHQYHH